MSPLSTTRRRAEAFQAAVEDPARAADDARYADLLVVVATLREAPEPLARPEFVDDLRSRLMAAAATALGPETPAQVAARRPTPRRTRREKQVAAVVGGFAIVTASATMSVASQSALPGDTLYPLKRALESVQTGVMRSDEGKAASLLERATGRLAEVDELSRADDLDAVAIEQTLEDFVDQATEAAGLLLGDYAETGSDASIEELRDFAAASMTSVEDLETLLPAETRGTLAEVAALIEQIDRQAVAACPLCGDALPAIASALTDTAEAVDPLPDAPGERPAPRRDRPTSQDGGSSQPQPRPDRPALPVVPDLLPDQPASTTPPSGQTSDQPSGQTSGQPSGQPSSQPTGGADGTGTGAATGGSGGLLDPPLLPGTGGATGLPGTGSSGGGSSGGDGGGRDGQGGSNPLDGALNGQLGNLGGVVDDATGGVGGLLGDKGAG